MTNITFYPENNLYKLRDKYGGCFEFTAMPYEKAKEEGLVRKLTNVSYMQKK